MKSSYLMVRCIMTNENKYLDQFSVTLAKIIAETYPNSEVSLMQDIPYWKHADSSEIIYNVTNDISISVCDFIKIFDLTWIFTDSIVFDVEKNKSVYEEEAIWSQLNHPLEIFIVHDIKWVDIYTWEND